MSRAALFILLLSWMFGVSSCSSDPNNGYAFASAHRTDISTIAVPIFGNTTYDHGLEAVLTEALVREISRSTPYRVTSRETAETTLSGSIVAVNLRKLSTNDDTGLVQELAYEVTVAFEWKNNSNGEVLVARRNFRASDEFVPANEAKERLEIGRRGAVDRLARDMVAELRSAW